VKSPIYCNARATKSEQKNVGYCYSDFSDYCIKYKGSNLYFLPIEDLTNFYNF
jgi:hypothetical protein